MRKYRVLFIGSVRDKNSGFGRKVEGGLQYQQYSIFTGLQYLLDQMIIVDTAL